jgi:hypothetical protein
MSKMRACDVEIRSDRQPMNPHFVHVCDSYLTMRPPSMTSMSPVWNADASEAR